MRTEVLNSTPVRLTFVLGIVFLLAVALSGTITWYLINNELLRKLDSGIAGDVDVISRTFATNDIADLLESLDIHIKASPGAEKVYYLGSASGGVLAGNISRPTVPPGWTTLSASALGLAGTERYRVLQSRLGSNELLVGASFAESDQIGRIAVTSFASGTALLTIVVAAFGFTLAFRGQRRLAHVSRTMTRLGSGDLTARLAVSSRGDDIDLISREINHAIDRLGQVVESMRQVSVDIAHDLKTPLSRLAISIYSAIEAERAGLSHIEPLLSAEKEIGQINNTFEALLHIAQIEAGARRSRFATVELGPIFVDLIDAYAAVAEENGQQLSIDMPSGLRTITGDYHLLTQLFANLIENAIRHSQGGAHIDIVAKDAGGRIVVEVSDDGPGIPEDEYEAVFRRLYRIERSRSTSGSGLGLSMVKAIADLHGAKIRLGGNNPGLRVIVEFPEGKSVAGRIVIEEAVEGKPGGR